MNSKSEKADVKNELSVNFKVYKHQGEDEQTCDSPKLPCSEVGILLPVFNPLPGQITLNSNEFVEEFILIG